MKAPITAGIVLALLASTPFLSGQEIPSESSQRADVFVRAAQFGVRIDWNAPVRIENPQNLRRRPVSGVEGAYINAFLNRTSVSGSQTVVRADEFIYDGEADVIRASGNVVIEHREDGEIISSVRSDQATIGEPGQ
jgi:hypothetical protein